MMYDGESMMSLFKIFAIIYVIAAVLYSFIGFSGCVDLPNSEHIENINIEIEEVTVEHG